VKVTSESRQQRRARERAQRKSSKRALLLSGLGVLAISAPLSANTITVDSSADTAIGDGRCTLREAINNANANADTTGANDCATGSGADVIRFAPSITTITLSGTELPAITESLTITGPGASSLTISGNNQSRIFHVEAGAAAPITVEIDNLTVTAGSDTNGGAILDVSENLTLDHVTVSGSVASGGGGGVGFVDQYGGALTITNSTISGNQCLYGGGGVSVLYGIGNVTISNTTISGNSAAYGGGFGAYESDAQITISGSTISGNSALYAGGGVELDSGYQPVSITNTLITSNTSGIFGGGVDVSYAYASVYLGHDTINGNSTSGLSGGGVNAVILSGSVLTVQNCVVSSNSAGTATGYDGAGGGLSIRGSSEISSQGTFAIADSVISGNTGDPNDAAATDTGDTSKGYGGGIYISYISGAVQRTTITGNTAFHGGGAYLYDGANVKFENDTIAKNAAKTIIPTESGAGGGVLIQGSTSVVAFNETTIAGDTAANGNTSQIDGGGIDVDTGSTPSVTLYNSIVANNTAAAGTTPDISGTVTATYTLIKTPGTATINGGSGNVTGVDPALLPLANNRSTVTAGITTASQTPQTGMPLCSSPVVNAGDPAFASPPATDERSMPRVVGGRIDMGSVELNPGTIQFSSNAQSVGEGSGTTVTVTRTGGTDGAITANYATANGTATAGSDYTAASGVLNWADGDSTNRSFNISTLNDSVYEGNEQFTASLSACAILGSPSSQTITIVDDETQPVMSIGDISLPEGDSGTTLFSFPVTLSGQSAQTITATFTTNNGTAVSGSDYTASSGTVTFTPGQTTQTITISVLGDTNCEPDETFTVTLGSPVNATIAKGTGTGTIQGGDCADLSITKAVTTPGPYVLGNNVSYVITASNAGPVAATSVTITDVIPSGEQYVSAVPSQGSCSGTSTVVCSMGTIANGASATVMLTVKLNATGTVTNTATAASANDPNGTNNAGAAGLAVGLPGAQIPTLDPFALALLAAILAFFGIAVTKK